MQRQLEVLFTPAEFAALPERDLTNTVCVVFDILRATSTMVTALANGAEVIVPVGEIEEALAARAADPTVLLAGEREGVRIRADLAGGIDFDLGNSPREFTPERVRGRRIVITTTNGTRALRACAMAKTILAGAFLNLAALGHWIQRLAPEQLLVVCSGTHDQASFEDTLAAGALCELIWPREENSRIADSAEVARQIYHTHQHDLTGAMRHARNGRRLLGVPDLAADVEYCLRRDVFAGLAELNRHGELRWREVAEVPL